jgi:hypothetical protein
MKSAKSARKIKFSPYMNDMSFSSYDRSPVRTPLKNDGISSSSSSSHMRRVGSTISMLRKEETISLKEVYAQLSRETGFLTMNQCLLYLEEAVRDTLEVPWVPENFALFADFHIRAVCVQSHVEQDAFTYEDLEQVVSTMRAVDNLEFIGTRLFMKNDNASIELRKKMRLVWTKKGEIVQAQEEALHG